jgi:hypothetical protein
MHPITEALLAVVAADEGDTAAAQTHLATAQRHMRTAARRDRQIVEIAALVVAGHRERAAGLAMEHRVEFPADADVLARLSAATSP